MHGFLYSTFYFKDLVGFSTYNYNLLSLTFNMKNDTFGERTVLKLKYANQV